VDSDDFVPSTADLQDVSDAGTSVSYDEYMNCLKVVEEERTQLAAQQKVIDEIAAAVSPDKELDQDVVDYITKAVTEAQIVDAETKDGIIRTAQGMSGGVTEDDLDVPEEGLDESHLDAWAEDHDDADASVSEAWGEDADNSAWDSMDDDSGWDAASGWDEE
jgi:hypothetical protein